MAEDRLTSTTPKVVMNRGEPWAKQPMVWGRPPQTTFRAATLPSVPPARSRPVSAPAPRKAEPTSSGFLSDSLLVPAAPQSAPEPKAAPKPVVPQPQVQPRPAPTVAKADPVSAPEPAAEPVIPVFSQPAARSSRRPRALLLGGVALAVVAAVVAGGVYLASRDSAPVPAETTTAPGIQPVPAAPLSAAPEPAVEPVVEAPAAAPPPVTETTTQSATARSAPAPTRPVQTTPATTTPRATPPAQPQPAPAEPIVLPVTPPAPVPAAETPPPRPEPRASDDATISTAPDRLPDGQ